MRPINRRQLLTSSAAGLAGTGLGLLSGRSCGGSKNAAPGRSPAPLERVGKPHTDGGPVSVTMPGGLAPARKVGGWPNLVEMATLALRHFNEICDPNRHYVPYIGGSLGWRVPAFNHHRYDWIEVLPYPLIARIVARRLTGSQEGRDVEVRQRQLLLSSFHNLDAFAYPHYVRSWGGGTDLCLWEQGRVLYALLAWFEESGDERLLSYARGMVQALLRISHRVGIFQDINPDHASRGAFGPLSPVSMVECLTKYAALTGDADAVQLSGGIVRSLLDSKQMFTDGQFRLSGFLRGTTAAIASIARYAAHTGERQFLEVAEHLFRSALHLIAASGATPEEEPCCTNMEMTTAALVLTRAGRGSWWDMIDRHFRNQIAACQLRDAHSVNVGSVPGVPQPWDDTRNVLERSIGGFAWSSPYEQLHWDRRLMLCCGGHAIWTLGKIVEHAVTEEADRLSVNLHFSLDTPRASITSWEPFEGLLEVVPHRTAELRVRKPSYASRVETLVNGKPVRPIVQGEYLAFGLIRAGTKVELKYLLPEKTTEEVVRLPQQEGGGIGGYCGPKADPIVAYRIETEWRGNTVLAIHSENAKSYLSQRRISGWKPQPRHRLYLDRKERYQASAGRHDTAAFFLPQRTFTW